MTAVFTRSRRGRLAAFFVLAVGMECASGGSGSRWNEANNCTVCRGVTQGFVDLHTEWPAVRQIEAAMTQDHGREGAALHDGYVPVTYEAAIDRFCKQSFLGGNQQRVCYSIAPFAAEVARWLGMGVPPDRVCLKLSRRNPDLCFDARQAERPDVKPLDWRSRPLSIPEGVECSIEHRNSLAPRWVLLD